MKNNKAIEMMEKMESIIEEMRKLNKMFEELINTEEIEEPVPYEDKEEDLDSFEFLEDEDLEDLLDDKYIEVIDEEEEEAEEEKEYQMKINSPAYHVVLTLRGAGLIVNYKDAEEFLEQMEDQFVYFDEKAPCLFTDEEIVEKYQSWLIWREF